MLVRTPCEINELEWVPRGINSGGIRLRVRNRWEIVWAAINQLLPHISPSNPSAQLRPFPPIHNSLPQTHLRHLPLCSSFCRKLIFHTHTHKSQDDETYRHCPHHSPRRLKHSKSGRWLHRSVLLANSEIPSFCCQKILAGRLRFTLELNSR